MSVSREALAELRNHWALQAFDSEALDRAHSVIDHVLVERAVGKQITFNFDQQETDQSLIERVALAYEMASIEGLDALSRASGGDESLRNQAAAASYSAFEFRRLQSVPKDTHARIFHILQISALAYCGDRWSDLRRWYQKNSEALRAPSVADADWDKRLLYRLFDCWVRLFRKSGWDDLDQIREIIAGLREDQKHYEKSLLSNDSNAANRASALRLMSLYHWAKATEVLAEYMLQGKPQAVYTHLDKHFESAIQAATASADSKHDVILRWLHAASRIMVTSSLWWGTRTVNSRVSKFVRSLTKREHQPMFELLPPQRAALLEQGLLDQAKTAIVIDMPTSGGKTLLAQFRILQALNQFDADDGWVAYVAPTRALAAQITRRLRRDFEPIGVRVEQLSAAVDVDAFEDALLRSGESKFHVLIATPEKLSLIIRNKKVDRPLALVVMDEAHNIENESRGLRMELLLATIKRDCPQANFLLLMPFVDGADSIASWLAQDVQAGKAISFGTTAWKPNERIVGLYSAEADDSKNAGWRLNFETLTVTEKAMQLRGIHRAGGCRPLDIPKSKVLSNGRQIGKGLQTAAMATVLSSRGTSIAIGNTIATVWSMARSAAKTLPKLENPTEEIQLVQNFLKSEVSSDFELVEMLSHGVGVHHAGLSDETRSLMEWLAELGQLRVLCATSTISQGINFPVSSIFLSSRFVPGGGHSKEMPPREFWNLAGRAGRLGHESVGVVGLAQGEEREEAINYIKRNTEALASRLVTLLNELAAQGELHNLSGVFWQEQWDDFRSYIAHLWAEKKNLDAVLADSEQLLRQTLGYTALRGDALGREKADALLEVTQWYARELANKPGIAELADSTGFSPEGVSRAMAALGNLEHKLAPSDWSAESLFGDSGRVADLYGVMLHVPQLKQPLEDVGGQGFDHTHLSNITREWVKGAKIDEIAKAYFSADPDSADTEAITKACRAIYKAIVNNGTWGVSALCQMSGIDFDALPEDERRRISALPAMIYHGVGTESAVLMRINSVPRGVATQLGERFSTNTDGSPDSFSVGSAREFLKSLNERDWEQARPKGASLSGANYRRVWSVLSGESL